MQPTAPAKDRVSRLGPAKPGRGSSMGASSGISRTSAGTAASACPVLEKAGICTGSVGDLHDLLGRGCAVRLAIGLRLAQGFVYLAHLSSLSGCFCDGSVEFAENPLVDTINGCGSRSRSEATAWISSSGTCRSCSTYARISACSQIRLMTRGIPRLARWIARTAASENIFSEVLAISRRWET